MNKNSSVVLLQDYEGNQYDYPIGIASSLEEAIDVIYLRVAGEYRWQRYRIQKQAGSFTDWRISVVCDRWKDWDDAPSPRAISPSFFKPVNE